MDIKFGIITCSDTRSIDQDTAGAYLKDAIIKNGWTCIEHQIVKDDIDQIADAIVKNTDELKCNIVITCGGTGMSFKDLTPEATKQVCDRDVCGIAEAMRAYSMKITPYAALSRAVCMQRGRAIVVNFPGSKKAAAENWDAIVSIFEHAVKMANGQGH